jgi:hypothetical protein
MTREARALSRPEMTDAQFAADAEWVMRDLEAAKRLLERSE